jgi:hypothetical protein
MMNSNLKFWEFIMAQPIQIQLTGKQRRELEQARSSHPKPYVRERATGILKVAAGQSVRQVALTGLLRRHDPETVVGWIARYLKVGLAGLLILAGRGRKPAFFPRKQRDRSR